MNARSQVRDVLLLPSEQRSAPSAVRQLLSEDAFSYAIR